MRKLQSMPKMCKMQCFDMEGNLMVSHELPINCIETQIQTWYVLYGNSYMIKVLYYTTSDNMLKNC